MAFQSYDAFFKKDSESQTLQFWEAQGSDTWSKASWKIWSSYFDTNDPILVDCHGGETKKLLDNYLHRLKSTTAFVLQRASISEDFHQTNSTQSSRREPQKPLQGRGKSNFEEWWYELTSIMMVVSNACLVKDNSMVVFFFTTSPLNFPLPEQYSQLVQGALLSEDSPHPIGLASERNRLGGQQKMICMHSQTYLFYL